MALPVNLQQQWVLPHPFQPPAAPHGAFARAHFPRLSARICDNLERFVESITLHTGFPPAPQTIVAQALNATTLFDAQALNSVWAHCLGVISIDKAYNFNMPGTQMEDDLNCVWTPLAVANRAPAVGGHFPRYRFLYVIHEHPGNSASTRQYSLSVYDREVCLPHLATLKDPLL